MRNLILITILLGAVLSSISILIDRYYKRNKKMKYLVPIVIFLGCVCFIAKAKYFSTGMQDLANIIMAMIIGGSGIITIIACVIIDIKNKFKSVN